MTLTQEDKEILKVLVKKELDTVEKKGREVLIVNSPFLSSVFRMESKDIPFLATIELYQEFLKNLLNKL